MPSKKIDPARKFADGVIAGKIVVCKYVRLFVDRHPRDLEQGKLRGLYFVSAK